MSGEELPPRDGADPLAAVRAAYDPAAFRATAAAVIDRLAVYLDRAARSGSASHADAPASLAVLPFRPPDEQVAAWATRFPGGEDPAALLERVVAASNHLHHPGYVGHQVTAPLPLAAVCDLVSSLLNNGTAVYEMGPVSTAQERILIRFLGEALGQPRADGVFTSGGSAGNLTALLAARQAKAGFDVWSEGAHAGPPLAVLVSEQAHYSVARALQIMGAGARAAWPVPVDERFRLRPEALPAALLAARAAGRRVIAVVASAGSTATGAFDPLEPVADFCAREGLWLHVDGAHGASAALSARHRNRLRGIERADSVVWDAHKMMLMPALLTAVLFREPRRSYEAFAQEASYLFASVPPEEQWFNLAGRTLECTKSMMAMKLYLALAVHGPGFFGDYLDGMFALAQRFADEIEAAPDFQLGTRPDANIVCFRHHPPGWEEGAVDRLQAPLRERLIASGRFYLVQTRLRGRTYLRTTLINPLTRIDDLQSLLDAIRQTAAALP